MRTRSPLAVCRPVRTADPLPWLVRWVRTRTVESSRAARTRSVPSVEPSSTTMTSKSIGSSTRRMRRRISVTVLRSLYTGTMTESSLYDGCVSSLSWLIGGRWGMGSATPSSYLGCEPFGRAGQTFPQLHLRLPPEPRLGERDVGPPLRRIVLRQRLVHDLRRAAGDLEDHLG